MIHRHLRSFSITQLPILLSKCFSQLGIDTNEFVILNAYLNHSNWYEGNPDIKEISKMTGVTEDNVIQTLKKLAQRGILIIDEQLKIDLQSLYSKLREIELSMMSISEQIIEHDIRDTVKLLPTNIGGIAVIGVNEHRYEQYMWSIEDMRKLGTEILEFTDKATQEDVDAYNDREDQEAENKRMLAEERELQRLEEKIRREQPKQGCIVLFRAYPSGLCKFTYSTSLLPSQKVHNIKEQYGDNTEILHILEVKDTMNFYHHFIKKQFKNRLADNSWYDLEIEDIEYFRSENFPPAALEWLN